MRWKAYSRANYNKQSSQYSNFTEQEPSFWYLKGTVKGSWMGGFQRQIYRLLKREYNVILFFMKIKIFYS